MKTRFLLLLGVIVLMIGLASCSGANAEISVPVDETYVITRSDFNEKAPIQSAVLFRDTLNEIGLPIKLATDFLNERKGEVAPEKEILFGHTERPETLETEAAHTLGRYDFLVKLVDTKLVVLAGSNHAYDEAARYLAGCYSPETKSFAIPKNGYFGEWNPPLRNLTLGGVPIEDFTIVVDSVKGWDETLAKTLVQALDELSGNTITIANSYSEPLEHEIRLALPTSPRELPFDGSEAHCGIYDGDLYIYGRTQNELNTVFNEVMAACFSATSGKEVADGLPTVEIAKAEEKVIAVKPGTDTLTAALDEAVKLMAPGGTGTPVSVILELADGNYTLTKPAVLDASSLKLGDSELTIRAAADAKPVINGLTALDAAGFTKVEGQEYYVYQFEKLEDGTYPLFHDFYDNGSMIPVASGSMDSTKTSLDNFANRDDPNNYKGLYVTRASVAQLGEIAFPTEITLHVEWEFATMHAVGVDYNDTKIVDGVELVRLKIAEEEWKEFVPKTHGNLSLANRQYYFSNHLSLIKPNTYVYDSTTGKLYYYPEKGAPAAPAYSTVETLISLTALNHVTFDGITFTGTGCARKAIDGYMSGQANGEKRYGVLSAAAVLLDNCADITAVNCRFTELGTNGLQSINRLVGITVRDSLFDDISMSAIALGNHNTNWDAENAMYNIHIENNVINNIGMEYPTATAIYISHVDNLKILHNTISETAYSAISVGWGWSTVSYGYGEKINVHNAEIAYNRFTDFMQVLLDGAAIYVLGGNVNPEHTEYFNFMHDNYAERVLDSTGQRGYYMDGAASNWEVYDSVIFGSKLPLFSQFHVESQYTHNNYMHDVYTDYTIDRGNHAPSRTTILGDNFVERAGKDALFAKYPKAVEIYEASGADWSIED